MEKKSFSFMFALVLILSYCMISFASATPKDIVLMIDNSGSMKKGDPSFMTKASLSEFISQLPDDTQKLMVAVLIFDHQVHMTIPLTIINETSKEDIIASLDTIDYSGQLTNIPAGIERAIYELQNKGQENSLKSIIFITDGIVDTGDERRDLEKTTWLRENLSVEAAAAGIKIFGIAFTDSADFELIQSLAQKTGGQYFRAQIPEEISDVFTSIRDLIMSMEPEPLESQEPLETISSTPPETFPEAKMDEGPVYVTEPPKPTPLPVEKKPKKSNTILFILIGLAILLLIVFLFLFLYRRKPISSAAFSLGRDDATDDLMSEALLRDVSGATDQGIIKIGRKVTKIGRIEGINHIVINQSTISRKHAVIEYKDHSFWVKDMESSNGTHVNGHRVRDTMQLNHGDTIAFDIYEFEFVEPEMAGDETIVDRTAFRSIDDLKEV